MSSEEMKYVFADGAKNVAIIGVLVAEDDFFLRIRTNDGQLYTIGKRFIVSIRSVRC